MPEGSDRELSAVEKVLGDEAFAWVATSAQLGWWDCPRCHKAVGAMEAWGKRPHQSAWLCPECDITWAGFVIRRPSRKLLREFARTLGVDKNRAGNVLYALTHFPERLLKLDARGAYIWPPMTEDPCVVTR